MKLRIRGNSIRLRLSQSEVLQLSEGQSVVESTSFPSESSNSFSYSLSSDSNLQDIQAEFVQGCISVKLSEKVMKEWADSDTVGLDYSIETPNGTLSILIEKDFACLTDRVNEDDSDAFPNPNTSC